MSLLRDITVSLVSPSFMRRMSLAASRFLSRLQSSLRDTNPPRSNFSTYCDTHKPISTQWCTKPPKMYSYFLILTWASLAVLKKYKEFPHRQVHSRLDACHTQTYNLKGYTVHCSDSNSAIYICAMDSSHFITLISPVPRDGQGVCHSCCQSVAMDQCNTLHLSLAHITCLYCIKMSLMRHYGSGERVEGPFLYIHIYNIYTHTYNRGILSVLLYAALNSRYWKCRPTGQIYKHNISLIQLNSGRWK